MPKQITYNIPPSSSDTDTRDVMGIVAIVILAALVFLFFVYGLPLIQRTMIVEERSAPIQEEQEGSRIEVNVPTIPSTEQPQGTTNQQPRQN